MTDHTATQFTVPAVAKAVAAAIPDRELLIQGEQRYDYAQVIGYNLARTPGRGSAIFLHVARPDYAPTDGCIALARDDLRQVLAAGVTELVVLG